jgi:ABC-2 type transport system permease protein
LSGTTRVFGVLLLRDLRVARRELPYFLVRTTLQPLLLVIVFGTLLPKMGFVNPGYTAALLPGILGISLAFSSLQAVALPMIADFGFTKEIEDRLLAPVPDYVIALEKVISGSLQGLLAAVFVLPIARLIMGPIPGLALGHPVEVVAIIALGATGFSALGLFLGTAIQGQQIGLLFSVIVAPMIMFGCAYYPWSSLHAVPALKYAVLVNPLVYVSEGLRAALTPTLPHMPVPALLAALAFLTGAFWVVGLRTFRKRAFS